jgi:hypothetical protein
MKRAPVVAAAIFAGTIPFQREMEKTDCDQVPCAVEPVVTTPEQPHASEEQYKSLANVEYVEIPSSPPLSAVKGSEHHLEWDAKNETKALDITDPETLKWLRERSRELPAERQSD